MSDDVVRLVTMPERDAAAEREYVDAAAAESEDMLKRALTLVRERALGERAVGVVIAIAFEDGGYGSLIPVAGDRIGHLIGAVADAQHRLIHSTEDS